MTDHVIVATFDDPHHLVAATRHAREHGLAIVDTYTPHPVHGLEEAMGLRPSRLPWACFFCGLTGVAFMTWFQLWTSAVDWRLNVGGRPWNSSLSFLCVTFEVMVLLAGLGSVAALLVACRLWPGKPVRALAERVNDDRFALVLEAAGAAVDADYVRRLLAGTHPLAVTEHWLDEERAA